MGLVTEMWRSCSSRLIGEVEKLLLQSRTKAPVVAFFSYLSLPSYGKSSKFPHMIEV